MQATQSKQPSQQWIGRKKRRWLFYSLLLVSTYAITACGGSESAATETQADAQIRAPYPTFTPTSPPSAFPGVGGQAPLPTVDTAATSAPITPQASPTSEQTSSQTTPTPTAPQQSASPASDTAVKAIINTPLVNIRSGPSTDFAIVTIVERGEEYAITGKNVDGDWWQVCCIETQVGWVAAEFVDPDGAVDSVGVVSANDQTAVASRGAVEAITALPSAATPRQAEPQVESAASPSPTATEQPTPTDEFDFDLIVKEQFPEPKVVRIFLYAYQGNVALEGYTLKVSKDNVELPVSATSFGGPPGFTWPVADVRQRFQNLKLEFPGVTPAGVWTVQLVKQGTSMGAPATFTLEANEPNQELYVRYERR